MVQDTPLSATRGSLALGLVLGGERIAELEKSFRERLIHTVVIMDGDANVIVGEDGKAPEQQGQRPDPCRHCSFILSSTPGAILCHKSDVEGARLAKARRTPLLYKCWSAKSNVAIPIMVGEDEAIGNVYAGQFFACVDNESKIKVAQDECRRLGFSIHSDYDTAGGRTEVISDGFFWTRGQLAEWELQQATFVQKAGLTTDPEELACAWRAVPHIGLRDALASVELLQSLANMLAQLAYDKLAYDLFDRIQALAKQYRDDVGRPDKKAMQLLAESEALRDQLRASEITGPQAATKLAEHLYALRKDFLRRRIKRLVWRLDGKSFWSLGQNTERLTKIWSSLAAIEDENFERE